MKEDEESGCFIYSLLFFCLGKLLKNQTISLLALERNIKLGAALDQIWNKYGDSAIYRVISGTEVKATIARMRLISRHKK